MLGGILISIVFILVGILLRGWPGQLVFWINTPIINRIFPYCSIRDLSQTQRITIAYYMTAALGIIGWPLWKIVEAYTAFWPAWQIVCCYVFLLYGWSILGSTGIYYWFYVPRVQTGPAGKMQEAAYGGKAGIVTHSYLPTGTPLSIENPENGKSISVAVVDNHPGRGKKSDLVRLTEQGMKELGILKLPIHVRVISPRGVKAGSSP